MNARLAPFAALWTRKTTDPAKRYEIRCAAETLVWVDAGAFDPMSVNFRKVYTAGSRDTKVALLSP